MNPKEQAAVDRAKANREAATNNQAQGNKQSTQTVDASAGAAQLKARLDPARQQVADFTANYVLGGVAEGLQRVALGQWTQTSEASFDILDAFSDSVHAIDQGTTLALLPEAPKKMLMGSEIADVAS